MECIQFMVNKEETMSVTYKSGQPCFTVFKRKYDHGFMEIFNPTSREGCKGLNIASKGIFVVSDDNFVLVYENCTYKLLNEVFITPKDRELDEESEILNIQISKDERFFAVLIGKKHVKEIEELESLHIFEIDQHLNFTEIKQYRFPERHRYLSIMFEFKKSEPENCIIFCNNKCVLAFNYWTEMYRLMYRFKNQLWYQPDYMIFNDNQRYAIFATLDDVLWVDMRAKEEKDIDQLFQLREIKGLQYFRGNFYILANKYKQVLGYYLLEIQHDINKYTKPRFLL